MRIIEEKFAVRFKKLRKDTGLTQEQFLREFNQLYNRSFTAPAISQYENGKRIPEIDALLDFAEFFGVTVDYLLGNSDIPTQKEKPADEGELGENVIIYNRNGKNVKKKFTKEQMSVIRAMLDATPSDEEEEDI